MRPKSKADAKRKGLPKSKVLFTKQPILQKYKIKKIVDDQAHAFVRHSLRGISPWF